MKECKRCGEKKDLTEFNKDSRGYYHSYCAPCSKEYHREYREKNREKILERDRKRRRAMGIPEGIGKAVKHEHLVGLSKKEYMREYNKLESRKKQMKEAQKRYMEKNRDEINQRRLKKHHERYLNDPEYKWGYQVMFHLRGVEKREEFKKQWDDIKDLYEFYDVDYDIDHKVPKTWFKKSTPKKVVNHLENLQVIDRIYNKSKSNRWNDPISVEYKELIQNYLKKEYVNRLVVKE